MICLIMKYIFVWNIRSSRLTVSSLQVTLNDFEKTFFVEQTAVQKA